MKLKRLKRKQAKAEQQQIAEAKRKAEEERKLQLAEEAKREEERKRQEAEQRQIAEAKRKAEEERKRQEELAALKQKQESAISTSQVGLKQKFQSCVGDFRCLQGLAKEHHLTIPRLWQLAKKNGWTQEQEELAALKQKQAAKLKNKKTRLRNQEIKIGIILGFTGPIDHLTPDMGTAADMAFQEASESSLLLGGQKVEAIRADSTCLDSSAATLAADRLVNLDKVVAILGADCSGVTTAIANNVGIPYGITMISPSATSPVLSKIDDNGYFFRTAPSDARQGQLLAEIAIRRLIKQVAVTYTNNKYGRLLADSFSSTYKKLGGEVTAMVPHEDGKVDYSTEVTSLDATGADVLAVFGYFDKGGRHIIQESLDSDAFDKFILTDGMYGESLIKHVDGDLTGTFGISPGTDSEKADIFAAMAKSAGIGNAYTGESYDAAALLILAIQSAWSTDSTAIASNVMRVANAPGEKILPGELTKGLRLIARGEAVDYVGATNVELIGSGEAKGSFEEFEISNKMFITIRFH
jgi:branched-chain amino acid transport system substrate-binding protein